MQGCRGCAVIKSTLISIIHSYLPILLLFGHVSSFIIGSSSYGLFIILCFSDFSKVEHLRIFAATMAAACFGNLIWGHMTEAVFYQGFAFNSLNESFKQWPYFILLGLGITASEFWLLHKKKTARKPWTFDKNIGWDVLAAYATLK